MTGTSESHDDDLPFLPPAPPTPPPPPPVVPTVPTAPGLRPPSAPPTSDGDVTNGEPEFDARAMVAAQRRAVSNPSYGTLPAGTDEGRAAARGRRDEANRKRRRKRRIGWLVALLFLVGISVAGFLAYRSYQDDQARRADEVEADVPEDADGSDDTGPAGPLGEQLEALDALDTLDDPARPSAGGALGAIDDAQDAVDDLATTPPATTVPAPAPPSTAPATMPPAPVIELDDVRPDAVVLAGTRLADVDGHEVYVVDAEAFAGADRLRYVAFLDLLSAQPQLPTDDPAFDLLPDVEPGELALAVRRDGDQLLRAVVFGLDPELRVDYSP